MFKNAFMNKCVLSIGNLNQRQRNVKAARLISRACANVSLSVITSQPRFSMAQARTPQQQKGRSQRRAKGEEKVLLDTDERPEYIIHEGG
jgi:hypothetical protein